jgi:opacity protein-like surface antigen
MMSSPKHKYRLLGDYSMKALIRSILAAAACLVVCTDTAWSGERIGGAYLGYRGFFTLSDQNEASFSSPDGGEFEVQDERPEAQGGMSLNFGYNWSKMLGIPVRTELEGNYRISHDLETRASQTGVTIDYSTHIANFNPMVNLYLDIPTGSWWRPYIGVGGGVSFNISNTSVGSNGGAEASADQETAASLAWSGQIGVNFRWKKNWAVQVGYKFSHLGKVDTGNLSLNDAAGDRIKADSLVAHDFILGITYLF